MHQAAHQNSKHSRRGVRVADSFACARAILHRPRRTGHPQDAVARATAQTHTHTRLVTRGGKSSTLQSTFPGTRGAAGIANRRRRGIILSEIKPLVPASHRQRRRYRLCSAPLRASWAADHRQASASWRSCRVAEHVEEPERREPRRAQQHEPGLDVGSDIQLTLTVARSRRHQRHGRPAIHTTRHESTQQTDPDVCEHSRNGSHCQQATTVPHPAQSSAWERLLYYCKHLIIYVVRKVTSPIRFLRSEGTSLDYSRRRAPRMRSIQNTTGTIGWIFSIKKRYPSHLRETIIKSHAARIALPLRRSN